MRSAFNLCGLHKIKIRRKPNSQIMTTAIQTHKMMLHKMKHSIQYEMLFVELEEFVKSFGDCQCQRL